MKKCPYCAEEILDAAIVCKHCGRDVAGSNVGTVAVAAPKKTSLLTKLLAGFFALMFLGWIMSLFSATPTTSTASSPSASQATGPLLALGSSRGYTSDGGSYKIVEGEVTSLASQSIRNLEAVTSWYSKDGTFISSDSALVDYNPLLPGQTTPFKTMTRTNPEMTKYSVEFKSLTGGTINTRDDRKK